MRHWRLLALLPMLVATLPAQQPKVFTRADTLRGTVTPQRAWWDVAFYDLDVTIRPADSSITGSNAIRYRVTGKAREMVGSSRVDLQACKLEYSIVSPK